MTQLLSIGYPQSTLQNVVYALPASRCLLYSSDLAGGTQMSVDGVTFIAYVLDANNQGETAGGFIRNTSVSPVVILKKAV